VGGSGNALLPWLLGGKPEQVYEISVVHDENGSTIAVLNATLRFERKDRGGISKVLREKQIGREGLQWPLKWWGGGRELSLQHK
jgi:hypothetical protein